MEVGSSDTLLHEDLALTVKMSDKLALSVGYGMMDNTKPPAPPKKLDMVATVTLVFALAILRIEGDAMGVLNGVLGGVVGAEMALVVNDLIQKHGGVQGIVTQLEQQGLAGTVHSWIGTGTNRPINADQIHQAFGVDTLKELAANAGLSPDVLAAKLSQALPQAIDKLTPTGAIPKT